MARGHDVTLLPVYTPTRTDEPNVSDGRVFFGGISVYLQQHVPLFRHTPAVARQAVGLGRASSGRLAGRASRSTRSELGELTVSMLEGEDGLPAQGAPQAAALAARAAAVRRGRPAQLAALGLAPPLKRALGRPVGCTLQGEDLFLDGLQRALPPAAPRS